MDIAETGTKAFSRLGPRVACAAERSLKRIPPVRRALDREYERMLSALAARLKPHRGQVTTHVRLPATGEARGGMAPVYGMADTLPFRGMVGDMLKRYIDLLYRP